MTSPDQAQKNVEVLQQSMTYLAEQKLEGKLTDSQYKSAITALASQIEKNQKLVGEDTQRFEARQDTRAAKLAIENYHPEWKARMIEENGEERYDSVVARIDKMEVERREIDPSFFYDAENRMSITEKMLEQKGAEEQKTKGAATFKKKKEQAEKGIDQQSDQNFLLQNLNNEFLNNAPAVYQMPRLCITQTEENLVNKLTTKKDMLTLMGASSADISSLVPYIRFFKSDKVDGKPRVREFKFAKSSENLEDYLRNGATGHSEIGLKSFDIKMTGTNSFTATRNFEGNLVLFFKSVADMDDSKGEEGELKWTDMLFNHMFQKGDAEQLAGIAASTAAIEASTPDTDYNIERREENLEGLAKERLDILKKRKAEIYVEYGYEFSENVLDDTKAALKSAIKNTRMVLALYPITTNFTFGKDGSAELSVGFTAASEQLADDADANILTLGQTDDERNKLDKLRAGLKGFERARTELEQKKKDTETIQKSIDDQLLRIEKAVKNNRISNYGRFMEYLYRNKRLFSVTVTKDDYKEGIWKPIGSKKAPDQVISAAMAKEALSRSQAAMAQEDSDEGYLDTTKDKWDHHTVGYFFLGDLLNYAAYALVPLENRPNMNKLRIEKPATAFSEDPEKHSNLPQLAEVVLGNFTYMKYPPEKEYEADRADWIENTQPININLTQLPVSYSLYHSFMRDVVIKHSGTVLTFDQFLKKAVEKLIVAAMDSFVDGRKSSEAKQQLERKGGMIITRIDGEGYKLWENRTNGLITDLDDTQTWGEAIEKVNLGGLAAKENIEDRELPVKHIIVHGSRIPIVGNVGDDEPEDAKRGIYHLSVGSRTGIVKDINFKQTSSRMKEINLQKQLKSGHLDALDILSMPYDADVTIYGNPGFYPGQYLYLRPSYVGLGAAQSAKSITKRLGLGGLYNLIGVSTRITPGTLSSELTCIQNNSALSAAQANKLQTQKVKAKEVNGEPPLEKEVKP